MKMKLFFTVLLLTVCNLAALGQPAHLGMQDELLNNLVGHWNVDGSLNGQPAKFTMDAEWVLDHQFLRIAQKEVVNGPGFAFEAVFFIGYDKEQQRYAAHLLTVFGGGDAPVGTGSKNGNEFTLTFKRPQGDVVYRFAWQPDLKRWHVVTTESGKIFLDLQVKPS